MKTIRLLLLFVTWLGALTHAEEVGSPYHATPARRAAILDGAKQIRLGMTAPAIEAILGVPDERNDTFDHIKSSQAHKIGYSHVYLLQRLRTEGSAVQKDEKLLRLHFGLDDSLIRIDDQTE